MLRNKTHVETVNFRLYFKVIIRQNETQFFYNLDIYNVGRKRLHASRSEADQVKQFAAFTTMFYITKEGPDK